MNYQSYYRDRFFLLHAVKFFAKGREVGFTTAGELPDPDPFGVIAPAQVSAMRVVNGKVNYVHLFPVGEILLGIDYDRLRICVICEKIFWAENKNSFTCSEPCRNALRQRRHREKNKEEVNAKRREYYRRNKKLKEIKEKKNGTI